MCALGLRYEMGKIVDRSMDKDMKGLFSPTTVGFVLNMNSEYIQQYPQTSSRLQKSYFKLFLFVALGSVPLDDGFTKVQQKHVSQIEALPAHLHLKQIKT